MFRRIFFLLVDAVALDADGVGGQRVQMAYSLLGFDFLSCVSLRKAGVMNGEKSTVRFILHVPIFGFSHGYSRYRGYAKLLLLLSFLACHVSFAVLMILPSPCTFSLCFYR